MSRITGSAKKIRIPHKVNVIQVNYCQNPNCENFGVAATQSRKDPGYTISGKRTIHAGIVCRSCGRYTTLKSNASILEEVMRFTVLRQLSRPVRHRGYSCPNPECPNFLIAASAHPGLYLKRGKTSSGNPKLQCKSCRKMFTRGSQRYCQQTENIRRHNQSVMETLVNGSPIRRMSELVGISAPAIYKKIDLIFEKCCLFNLEREGHLPLIPLKSLKLCTDRQEYLVNWTNRKDKRTTQVTAIGTADIDSKYVFGMEVNFDPEVSMSEVIADSRYAADLKLKSHGRTFARFWTPDEVPDFFAIHKQTIEDKILAEVQAVALSTEGDRDIRELSNRLTRVLSKSRYCPEPDSPRRPQIMLSMAISLVVMTNHIDPR